MERSAETSCIEIGTDRNDAIPQDECAAIILLIDRALNVVLEPANSAEAYAAFETPPVENGRLTAALEAALRTAARGWIVGGSTQIENSAFSIPPYHTVRAHALDGVGGGFLALTIEHRRERRALARARQRFELTAREQQVLRFILEGAQANEIATALSIAESTVQGYFKRLLAKTRSRNRAAMVALVLDWNVRWERASSTERDASA